MTCPVSRCKADLLPRAVMCAEHWNRLPARLKRPVEAARLARRRMADQVRAAADPTGAVPPLLVAQLDQAEAVLRSVVAEAAEHVAGTLELPA